MCISDTIIEKEVVNLRIIVRCAVAGLCERDIESSDSVKGGNFYSG